MMRAPKAIQELFEQVITSEQVHKAIIIYDEMIKIARSLTHKERVYDLDIDYEFANIMFTLEEELSRIYP